MPHLKALTSVRAIAAIYVGMYHMVFPFEQWGPLSDFMAAGYTGVSFFFMLSGFILMYTHGVEYSSGRAPARKFWMARFARVYPLYALSLIWAGYVCRYQFHPRFHIVAYFFDFLLLQSWSVRMAPYFSVVAWSLSAEAFFYFVFPFVGPRLRPRTGRSGLWIFFGCWVLALLPAVAALLWDARGAWEHAPAGQDSHVFVYAMRRYHILLVGQFLSGVALGWIYLQRPISRAFGQFAVYTGFAGTLLILCFSSHFPFVMLHNGLLIPLFALVILGLSQSNIVSALFSRKSFVILGEASYAFYLFHFLFNVLVVGVYHWPTTIAGLIPRLLILIPASIALHFLVERPGRRLILRWWNTRQTAGAIVKPLSA
jgi:peptidoglycan/LPS O-acetylase OafA/YrhL